MDADTLAIIRTVLTVGIALAGLSIRTAARQDRRMDRFEAATAAHLLRSMEKNKSHAMMMKDKAKELLKNPSRIPIEASASPAHVVNRDRCDASSHPRGDSDRDMAPESVRKL